LPAAAGSVVPTSISNSRAVNHQCLRFATKGPPYGTLYSTAAKGISWPVSVSASFPQYAAGKGGVRVRGRARILLNVAPAQRRIVRGQNVVAQLNLY